RFHQAVALDPDYALAWAGIADSHGQLLTHPGIVDPAETTRLGLEAARRAIALNPRLPEAHKAEALVLRFSKDPEGARAALVRALEADPRFTPALINLGVDRYGNADLAGAERMMRRALEVDPEDRFSRTWLGWLLVMTRRFDEVQELLGSLQKHASHGYY